MQIFDVFFLEAVLNGLLFGGVLALLALGLNLVFGVIDVVWICYAELMMIGMYTVYFLYTVYKLQRMAVQTARLYLLCFAYHRFRQINDNLVEAFIHLVDQYEKQAKLAAAHARPRYPERYISVR